MEDFFDNELVQRFEEMIENKDQFYFDSEQLEDIIIYYLELGDITFAEKAVQYGLALHPGSLEIKTKLLEVLLEMEDYEQARPIIEELANSSQENTDYLVCCAKYYSNLGNPHKSIEYCQKALDLNEEENFLHNFIADEYTNLGDPFLALKHYRLALKHDPTDDYSLENTMKCYVQLKKFEEAEAFINHYLDDFAFNESAWIEYGQFFFHRKNYQQALRGFDFALAINSTLIGVYASKASCLEAMEEFEKAIEVYHEMLELEDTKAYTHYKIGLNYKELKQTPKALAHFQQSLLQDPQFHLSMIELSDLYEHMGSIKEALHYAKEAAHYSSGNLALQKRLAYLYINSGRFEESLECLKKLVEKEPNRFYNWYAYIEVLMLLGEYEQSIEVLTHAIQIHQKAELYYQLSNCFYQLKMEDKGIESLEIAITLDATLLSNMKEKYPFIIEAVNRVKTRKK